MSDLQIMGQGNYVCYTIVNNFIGMVKCVGLKLYNYLTFVQFEKLIITKRRPSMTPIQLSIYIHTIHPHWRKMKSFKWLLSKFPLYMTHKGSCFSKYGSNFKHIYCVNMVDNA